MGSDRTKDHKKEFVRRLWALDVRDEEFIERFFRRHDVEGSLESAARFSPGRYEED